MNCIQAYNVKGWEVVSTEQSSDVLLTYLTDDVDIIMRLYSSLVSRKYETLVASKLKMMRNATGIKYSASGKFYVNNLLWEIYTDELSTGDYRSYLFTEFNCHCIFGCVDVRGPGSLLVYQRDLKTLLRSIALTRILDESATLRLAGASVTVYSQTELVVNENSNSDALFFLGQDRYVVFYPCATDSAIDFVKKSDELIHSFCCDGCKIKRIASGCNSAKFYITRNGITSYCTYAEFTCNDDTVAVLSHDKFNRDTDLLSEFRIEVIEDAI
ncbi:hypothetical protein AALB53_09145 [Lachnospiraceae bacterium 47-T17]